MDLQSARARSGVLLIDFVDHTFDVGSGRNGNLIIDDHRRLRLQVDRLTTPHGFGVDGDDASLLLLRRPQRIRLWGRVG